MGFLFIVIFCFVPTISFPWVFLCDFHVLLFFWIQLSWVKLFQKQDHYISLLEIEYFNGKLKFKKAQNTENYGHFGDEQIFSLHQENSLTRIRIWMYPRKKSGLFRTTVINSILNHSFFPILREFPFLHAKNVDDLFCHTFVLFLHSHRFYNVAWTT